MQGFKNHPEKARQPGAFAACLVLLCAMAGACKQSPQPSQAAPPPAAAPDFKLAAARVDLAKTRPADEALALLVSALEADPTSAEALTMATDLLAETRWNLPETSIHHGQAIDLMHFAKPSSLWVSLSGETNTTVRWNLESMKIEATLFPIAAPPTRSLTVDPSQRSAIIERAGVLLLCNAQTLKPIRDIGPLPEIFSPASVIVFSPDGLLLAHPAFASKDNPALVWQLRDAGTGEILRQSDPQEPHAPLPLAAFLDRRKLRVLHADGSLFEMPVSPAEPAETIPASEPVDLLAAHFATNGGSVLTLMNPGPHRAAELCVMPIEGGDDHSLAPASLLERFAWNRSPGIWSRLLEKPEFARLRIGDRTAHLTMSPHAPVHAGSAITSLAIGGDRIVTGSQDGTLAFFRLLPPPLRNTEAPPAKAPAKPALAALAYLTEALAGLRYDDSQRSFTRSDAGRRMQALEDCDFKALAELIPALDFTPAVNAIQSLNPTTAGPEALLALRERIERSGLKTAASAPGSAELKKLGEVFETSDNEAVIAAIGTAGKQGPAAAKALELALASTHPEWIEACLAQASDLPPLLRKLAVSRIAWLQDRKTDALAGWPDVFPDLKQVRLREDWDGWEQADFSQALEKLRLCVSEELAAIEVPESPTPEQRKAVFERLTDPATVKAVGKARFARACLKAALAFSAFKEETETTFRLATIARNLGEAPAPCLRAEAMALTALGDYQKAHERWIKLITEHPVEQQEPGDYAESAYTAFENADPQQAMAILTTGIHRFPNDANFALRAGWVALLTGNADPAYRFLLTGRQIGYPEEKLENATALLAIAAAQTGAAEDAAVFYQDLMRLDPAWENPETIETLEWPEELKASLRQLAW
jgi:tetratricopeptide (TPR) repeat protein